MPTSPRRAPALLLAALIVALGLSSHPPASLAAPAAAGRPAGSAPVPDLHLRDDEPDRGPANYHMVLPVAGPPPAPLSVTRSSPLLTLDQTENILILGMDYRPGAKMWRTDSIMIVAVDQITGQAGIISVPRDLWVDIPGYGGGRINVADFYGENTGYPGGGPALVGGIIEAELGLDIHHWVRIQQEGLVGLVDALGGVTITLDCPLYEKTPHPTIPGEYEYLQLPAGENHLDGITAKKFATFRYATTDFNRARRQQQLIWALRGRADEIDLLRMAPELWNGLAATFQTDLSLVDVLRLAALGVRLDPEDVRGMTFPRDLLRAQVIEGSQVLTVVDREALRTALNDLFAARPLADLGRSPTGRCY